MLAASPSRERVWLLSEVGAGCAVQVGAESVLLKKKLYTKEEGSGPLCFLRRKIPADVILLDDLKCL